MFSALLNSIRPPWIKPLIYALFIAVLAWVELGGGCRKETAGNPDTIDTFADLFLDLARATQESSGDTSALRQRHEALLRAYDISPTEMQQALQIYNQHPEQWIQILKRMDEKAQKEGKKRK